MKFGAREFSLTNFLAISAAGITIYSAFGFPNLNIFFSTEGASTSVQPSFTIGGLLLLAFSWGLLGWRELVYSRKAKYSEAIGAIREALEYLKEADSAAIKQHSDHARSALESSAKAISKAFSLVTSVNCHVCIKDLYFASETGGSIEDKRQFKVSAICRSDSHRNKKEEDDWLSDNSDFLELFEDPSKPWFFDNNLPKREGYKNSHWSQDVYQSKSFPYRSTIVWPIRSYTSQGGEETLVGYLCVDAKSRNVFEERYDGELGASFASALCPTIMKIRNDSN